MTATVPEIQMDDIPENQWESPDEGSADAREAPVIGTSTDWFNPEYPHSTEAHPFGYFPGSDGLPDFTRPRKRRPHGKRAPSSSPGTRMPATHSQAEMAANVLKTLNSYVAMSLSIVGLPMSSSQLVQANDEFRDMAYQALLNDPELCNRILSAGSTSGKAQLTMAYVMLGGAMTPMLVGEIKEKRAAKRESEGTYDA